MRLLVVASAHEDIGRGRAMRCYAVAQAWMRLAPEAEVVWFGVLGHEDVREKVEAAGFSRKEVYRHGQWILIDNRNYTPEDWAGPKNHVATFSDLGARDLSCADLVINYAPYAHLLKYDAPALIGPAYTPIRDEIRAQPLEPVKRCGSGLTALEHLYSGNTPCWDIVANDQVAQGLWLRHEELPDIDGKGADRIVKAMLERGRG